MSDKIEKACPLISNPCIKEKCEFWGWVDYFWGHEFYGCTLKNDVKSNRNIP
jgi:hypothetical protein